MNNEDFTVLLVMVFVFWLIMMSDSAQAAGEHRVYGGVGWTHWSNVDAGPGYNDKYEDSGDHYGINIEYQYHLEDFYSYASFGVGNTTMKKGWDCSGCNFPSEIRFGVKWRIF